MKSEVYSWRVAADLKSDLEREARRRNVSLSSVLDRAAREWLQKSDSDVSDGEEQLRLHKAASECFGTIASDNAHRSEEARETLRKRLKIQNGR